MTEYNTDINILGSIPDYHLIYKALPMLYDKDQALHKMLVTDNEFNFRTEKSRKRFSGLLTSAFINDNETVNQFIGKIMEEPSIDVESKGVIVFWVFSMNNKLFRELNNQIFFRYYFQGRAELPAAVIEAYLKDLISRTPELKGKWSEKTIQTISSKYLTVLKKLNLLEGSQKKKFRYISMSDGLITCLIHIYTLLDFHGGNFLEHEFSKWMFVSEESMLERLKKIGKKDWIKMNYTGTSLKVESVFDTKNIIDGIFRRP